MNLSCHIRSAHRRVFLRKKATFDGVPDWVEATEETLRTHLFNDRPSAHVLLGELDSRVVGFAIYFLTFSSFLMKPEERET